MCNGKVCHQDDIGMTFGTCISPTSQQTALSNEIMGRWVAFATNGNPNREESDGVRWNKVGGGQGNLNVLRLGATDVVNQTLYPDLCGPVFGSTVPFNFQLF
jgi:carboxylesterase type B